MKLTKSKKRLRKSFLNRTLALLILLALITGTLLSCTKEEKKEMINIGVLQLVEHDALDQAYKGFVDRMAEEGYIDGKNIKLNFQNAQGNQATANTIANELVSKKSDLILAIATPAVQAVKNATSDSQIPVVFSAVTDAAEVGLIEANEKPGNNITGASDMTPVKEQIKLLSVLYPEAKKIGLLYSTGEANSEIQAIIAREAAKELGLETEDFTFSDTSQVAQVVENAVKKVDALYSPTDNNVATAVSNIVTITNENQIPFIVGEDTLVKKGALATFGLSYYELGKLSADLAIRILKGENPGEIPVAHLENFTLLINEETAKKLNLTIPENLDELF